jgi:membrane peptidoglycan carboxypeptidase
MHYHVGSGQSSSIRFPAHGPYDLRLGYVRIPEWSETLTANGYTVTSQARWSKNLITSTDLGIFPIYQEKPSAGITIDDRRDLEIMHASFPQRVYQKYDSIPPILVHMLLYVENRDLLDDSNPYRNPAIEWKRQGKAVMDLAISLVDHSHNVVGVSTLATQIEKFRHSPEGRTTDAIEKLRQITTASLRAYRFGERTIKSRKRIVLDYINSIPLSAAPGFGEVIGLGDGLWVWYGMDFMTANQLMREMDHGEPDPDKRKEIGAAIKAALSIFLAQRRPSAYLVTNRDDLETLTNSYLRVMTRDGLISPAIRDAALSSTLRFSQKARLSYPNDTSLQKAANLVRSKLLAMLDIDRFYDLDRIDLQVKTTLDLELQKKVTAMLMKLQDPEEVEKLGLIAPYLLEKGDPKNVIYSVSLFEKTPDGNLLRVQTNNYDGPFNIDEQTKLDLGSSAKLRTIVHYLEIIKDIHDIYSVMDDSTLTSFSRKNTLDPLTRWSVDYLKNNPNLSLQAMLDAAMARRYSASPGERIFTGGGLQTFSNFNKDDNSKIMPVSEAFRNSVNLVFIRIMRDIVYYHIFQRYGTTPRALEKIADSEKKRLLSTFADKEGKFFIRHFYEKYSQKTSVDSIELLFDGIQPTPPHLAAVFRFLKPDAPIDAFVDFLNDHLPESKLTDAYIDKLYNDYAPGKFTLADIGYISNVHPLELWLVRYICEKPGAGIRQIIADSTDVRQEVYRWLFKTHSHRKQFQRIRTIIDLEAFQDIHRAWKRLGYPFDYLTPSYATTIGSSADRPAALAELSGIILNNGIYKPMERVQSLQFGINTPYETRLEHVLPEGERVLSEDVAQTVKNAMLNVVEEGTARRVTAGLTLPDGTIARIGGKTGTGDNRYKTFGPGGILLRSRVINRTAIFVFFIGDRFFGTITAYVDGKNAGNYSFSSGLPVQVLKLMLPDIAPLFEAAKDQPFSIVLPTQSLKMICPDIAPFLDMGDGSF